MSYQSYYYIAIISIIQSNLSNMDTKGREQSFGIREVSKLEKSL